MAQEETETETTKALESSEAEGVTYEELVDRIKVEQRSWAEYQFPEDPPAVPEVVRIVGVEDWAGTQVSCLAEAGFEAEESGGGIHIPPGLAVEQAEALNRAAFECGAMYPIDPRRNDLLDENAARILFRHLRDVATPCIENLGHKIDDVPSEDSWVAKYLNSQERWDPYAVASQLSAEEFNVIYDECPDVPAGLYPAIPAH